MPWGPLKPLLRATFGLVLPTVVACLVVLELGLRVQGRLPSNVTDGIFVAHGDAYRLKPDQQKLSRTPSYTCTVYTNALGLRDAAPGPRPLTRPYLAWMGDSATFANGVEYEQSFVGRIGAHWERRGVEVVNLAVGGHHIAEQEEMLRDFAQSAPRKPDAVAIVFTPQLMALFDGRYEDLVVRSGYVFPGKHWLGPYVLVMLGNASSAYCFLRDGIRALQARWRGGGGDDASAILSIYSRSFRAVAPENTRRMEDRIERLDGVIRALGATPLHVYLPTTADLRAGELLTLARASVEEYDLDHYREALRRESERTGVKLIDLTSALGVEHAKGKLLGFSRDMHYNAAAHAVIAEALADLMQGDDWMHRPTGDALRRVAGRVSAAAAQER